MAHTITTFFVKLDGAQEAKGPKLPPVKRDVEISQLQSDPEMKVPMEIAQKAVNHIEFYVNGKIKVIRNPHPTANLATYLRESGLTGLKIGCGEGGCGCCTVILSTSRSGVQRHRTVNACLRPLCSVDGYEITTIERLGSKTKGYHALQQKIVDESASQCGYCTPGFINQMYGLLLNNPSPDVKTIENNFGGNLCRCTGYAAILKAFKSFSKEDAPVDEGKSAARVDSDERDSLISARLRDRKPKTLLMRREGYVWATPTSLEDLHVLTNFYKDVPKRLVVGNTSKGVVKYYSPHKDDNPRVFINVSQLDELSEITQTDDGLTFGSSVTVTDMISYLKTSLESLPAKKTSGFTETIEHLEKVATPQVRNTSSWAGNLMTAKTHPDFPSDLAVIFSTLNATVHLKSRSGDLKVPVDKFLVDEISNDFILQSLTIPFHDESVKINTYLVALRDNAHAVVNAGFRIEFDDVQLIRDVSIVYGGLKPGLSVAKKAQDYLAGKPLISQTLKQSLQLIGDELKAENIEDRSHVLTDTKYRENLAVNLFYKFFLALQENLPPNLQTGSKKYERPIAKLTNSCQVTDEFTPIGQPIKRVSGLEQAAGEAVFVFDQPITRNGLFGAPVLSTRAKAKILSIDASAAFAMYGVVDLITAKDIQDRNGANDCGFFPGDYPVFAEDGVIYNGQMIGLILAETKVIARSAVKKVKVEYGEPDTPAILTIKEGIEAKAWVDKDHPAFPSFNDVVEKGDVAKGFQESQHVVSGELNSGVQTHFYMEPQTATAYPVENRVRVEVASQGPSSVRTSLEQVLNLPGKDIIVVTKRTGGGFGGKIFGCHANAAAVSLGALKHGVPVRCQLSRSEDQKTTGSRHEFYCHYKIGFDDDGTIHAIEMNYVLNAGCSYTLTHYTMKNLILRWGESAYSFPNAKFSAKAVLTNTPNTEAMRSPGQPGSVSMLEAVIDEVVQHTKVDGASIRERLFYKHGEVSLFGLTVDTTSLPAVWAKIREQCDYENLVQEAKRFNMKNKWRKRGVAMMPYKRGFYYICIDAKCLVNIHGDGSVMLTHGGVEVGQGINTIVSQAVAHELGCSLDQIYVSDNSTEKIPFSGITGASLTTESNVKAAIFACEELTKRLKPIREANPDDDWEAIVVKAVQARIHLSYMGHYHPDPTGTYLSWSAVTICSEIDVLTGEMEILSADIVYDGGQSLNPAVDLGQIEGAFIMGVGFAHSEDMVRDHKGKLLATNTWDYHIPNIKSIPQNFNVTILENNPYDEGVYKSKASQEPAVILANCSLSAVRMAIAAAREDQGNTDPVNIRTPMTPERTQLACQVKRDYLTLD